MDYNASYEKPSKICKLANGDFENIYTTVSILDSSLNESETCVICMEPWTTSGDHRIVSIKCGHVFGQKCIEAWMHNNQKSTCPTCKRICNKKDIRHIFLNVKTLKFEDNDDYLRKVEEISTLKSSLKCISEECSQLRLMNKLMSIEIIKLTDDNKNLTEMSESVQFQLKRTQNNNSQCSSASFQLIHKLQISAISGCRVMGYSKFYNKIYVSCPSSNRIVTGFGVRVVDVETTKVKKYISLHAMAIRHIEFDPFGSSNLMLSCSLDKSVKMVCTNSDSVVSHFECSVPVWSCTWSKNPNIIYAGLSNGTIEEIDNRKLTSPVSKIYTSCGGPIHSMHFVSSNDYVKNDGLVVTNSQGVLFLRNSSGEYRDTLANHTIDTLLMSKRYNSSIVHTAFNNKSFHLLNTFRPSESVANVRYLLSSIESMEDESGVVYASDINSFYGSKSMEFMSRSCILSNDESENLLVSANEETSSIKVWNLNSGLESMTLYPKDVIKEKPVLDICQYNRDPIAFAALNSDNLYLYKSID